MRTENTKLREQNDKLTKEVVFYKRVVDRSMKSHWEDSNNLEVVTEVADGYYQRVEGAKKGNGFAKAFLLLTIFTVMIQTVSVSSAAPDGFSREAGTARLNSYDFETVGGAKEASGRSDNQLVDRVGLTFQLGAAWKHFGLGGRPGSKLQENPGEISGNGIKMAGFDANSTIWVPETCFIAK